MNVILRPEAEDILIEISEFIESINTDGSGKRWLDKIQIFLASYARSNVLYALCQK